MSGLVIYTDGACSGNPGPGGWAWAVSPGGEPNGSGGEGHTTNQRMEIYAVLDAGINHAEPVGSEYHQLFPVNRFAQPLARRYTLVGPICTPGDTLYSSILLPELAVGDTLAIMDSGAYFVPFSTSFSFPRPGLVMVDSGRESVLRRAETFEDLTRCDDL